MNRGDGERRRRLTAAVREVPRAVGEGLLTVARDPLPRSVWLGRVPHVHAVALILGLGVSNAGRSAHGVGHSTTGLLLNLLQCGAALLALSRPVPAWWLSTTGLVLVGAYREATVDPDVLWPWSIEGTALHTLVLLLLALRVRSWVTCTALALTVLSGLAGMSFTTQPHNVSLGGSTLCFAAAAAVGGSLRRSRVARVRLAEQKELTAAERSRRTLLEERGRIARELHDVVAHHMSVISIQAQVAPHLVTDPSDELKENLAAIRGSAVEALTELRRVLGVLRAEDAAADGVRHAPQPTLARLGELVGKVRGAGVTVTTGTTGEPRPLAPGVELSAFRIVQEALSNAMRHAPGATVRVTLAYGPAVLTVRVTNTAPDRPAPPSTGAGHGLLGMRERVAMLGGELATGPTPDGGYEIVAELPAHSTKDLV
ncbi:sensor histidine kinase [Streptomyces hesseae]|uniref:histidine kinase n=1 Tax=Streptomyces hesseae TaxID=3075519 RepID=A0ABU2SH20_9ACTN|nr:histidine kinase [Streptomyces sp. DSM 40473]MDT0448192.1 histidine kinase [Streptomyces sp. DSM 40473]